MPEPLALVLGKPVEVARFVGVLVAESRDAVVVLAVPGLLSSAQRPADAFVTWLLFCCAQWSLLFVGDASQAEASDEL